MFNNLTPVVKNLLIINIGMFVVTSLFPYVSDYLAFYTPYLPFEGESVFNPNFKIWQIITYMFLHASLGHIFSNMFGLFIFGSGLENYMGSKRFLSYYLITGVGAVVIYSIWSYYDMQGMFTNEGQIQAYIHQHYGKMVGASGALFGILVAYGVLFPNTELMLLFFPFPIKAKYFVTLYMIYELYAGTNDLSSNVAHFAHIGGGVTGFILLKLFNFDKRLGY